MRAFPPIEARRGAWGRTWWAKAWLRGVEEAAFSDTDLTLARRLARSGVIGGIVVGPGQVVAAVPDRRGIVTGASRGLVTVEVRVPAFDDEARAAFAEAAAAASGRVAALLGGELPHDLVEAAEELGAELVPYGTELECRCTCVGWLDPCPHALAVLCQVTWLVEHEPLLLLLLRGVDREELLDRVAALTARRAPDVPVLPGVGWEEGEPEAAADLETDLDLAEAALHAARDLLAQLAAEEHREEAPGG
ncbi:hypothetical protein [Nocardioides sp.]|uniref:SWIM zinc finger family protein n=1 Tax=Nocardioides sp. TaxID=35761 RepID=UPI00351559AC